MNHAKRVYNSLYARKQKATYQTVPNGIRVWSIV